MPFQIDETTTPKGAPLLRVQASGHVSLAHAEELAARVAVGGPNHGWSILTIVARDTEYAREARNHFQTMKGNYRGLATVVTSPILRAAINMMLRLAGNAPHFRMFKGEAEALAWLDGLPERAAPHAG